ncbi:MAG TPA: hypothetical protein VN493_20635 [Thermoanaerobaculia bacterium]|nr:hypothetical protein [Thermoanaerobaculia bacterium]
MVPSRILPSRLACFGALVLLACSPPEGLSFSTAAPAEETRPAAAPRIPLTVRETAGVARSGEVLSTGVPLPRSLGARDTRWFAVTDAAGRPVPADFRVLARWNAGLEDSEAPIQWALVSFPATVGAKQSAVYSLVVDGSVANPPPPRPLTLSREGDRIVVDTGAAVFSLDGETLFTEIRTGEARLVTGSELSLSTPKKTAGHPTLRKIRIEQDGPLSAVVIIEGAYDLPPVGKGGFGSLRRYVFTAGSPTAIVRQAVAWEGNLGCNGCLAAKDGTPNGVRIERVRDTLALNLGAEKTATVVGDFEAAALEGSGPAWVRQVQRPDRHARLRFEAAAGAKKAQGDKADGGMIAVFGPEGSVAVALNHLHRYEPQALRLLEDGRLAVDLADGPAWLAHHQGMFATFAVAALSSRSARPGRADLDRLVWAPLNRPLRAWPDAAWFAGSDVVGELPVGALPKGLAAYDKLVRGVLERTVEEVDAQGIAGLMTFGVFPRYWGGKAEGDLRCKNDPTPQEAWDEVFWCGRWTDYHDTIATVPLWAMRSGEVEWLDEIAVPGALRTLHTQVMQCAPGDSWFYCGQAPAGYGGYRADFNSSHAYFDNLFLYYWLTGDSTVVETLRRGGESMRRRMCGAPPCVAADPPGKATFTGRVAGQWLAAFRFLGLASGDASFLDDWRTGLARAVTHQYMEVERDGKRYGFLGKKTVDEGVGGGLYEAGPIWQVGFYDGEGLYRLMRDTGDTPIGDPPVRPSQVLAALARSVVDVESRVKATGSPRGEWPQALTLAWDGARVGGRLRKAEPKGRNLYGPEKAGMAALLVRAGQQTGDRELLEAGREMVEFVLAEASSDRAPLGKLQGQYLTRLHAAVARLANGAPSPSLPRSAGEGAPTRPER